MRIIFNLILIIFLSLSLTNCKDKIENKIDLSSNELLSSKIEKPLTKEEWRLIVYGKDISDKTKCQYYIDRDLLTLPFIQTVKEMGAQVEWGIDNIADISINGNKYTLDIENYYLCNNDNPSINIFANRNTELIPDYFAIQEKELVINVGVASTFIHGELNANVIIDSVDKTVSILHKDDKMPLE